MRRILARSILAGTLIATLGAGTALGHECFIASRSDTGTVMAGTHSRTWLYVGSLPDLFGFVAEDPHPRPVRRPARVGRWAASRPACRTSSRSSSAPTRLPRARRPWRSTQRTARAWITSGIGSRRSSTSTSRPSRCRRVAHTSDHGSDVDTAGQSRIRPGRVPASARVVIRTAAESGGPPMPANKALRASRPQRLFDGSRR